MDGICEVMIFYAINFSQRGALPLDVVECERVIFDQWCQLLKALLVERVDVGNRVGVEELRFNQGSAVGHDGEVFPAKVIGVDWVFLAEDVVLDSDSELAVFVVAGFIREEVAFEQFARVGSADSDRAFVHVQEVANAVSSAVLVVKAGSPKGPTRQNVHVCARDG